MTRGKKLNRKAIEYSLAIKDFMVMYGAKEESAKSIAKMVQLAYIAGAIEIEVEAEELTNETSDEKHNLTEFDYKLDAEKKELRNIEKQAPKPKWSDDDEQYLLVCKNALRKYQVSDKWDAEIISKWLEDKLKQGEQKPKWSEEDECYMSECIGAIATKDGWSFEEKRKTKHWLKSLKQRQVESKWIEEDSKMLGTLIAIFEVNYPDEFYKVNPIGTTDMQGIYSSEIVKWLRTIKQRMEE